MVGLSPTQFNGVHMNEVPVVEDLLTLSFLLYDTDIVDGEFIGEFARRSVQKYENNVRLLRHNKRIHYVGVIITVIQSFRCHN